MLYDDYSLCQVDTQNQPVQLNNPNPVLKVQKRPRDTAACVRTPKKMGGGGNSSGSNRIDVVTSRSFLRNQHFYQGTPVDTPDLDSGM